MTYPPPQYFAALRFIERLDAGEVPPDLDPIILKHALLTELQLLIGAN